MRFFIIIIAMTLSSLASGSTAIAQKEQPAPAQPTEDQAAAEKTLLIFERGATNRSVNAADDISPAPKKLCFCSRLSWRLKVRSFEARS